VDGEQRHLEFGDMKNIAELNGASSKTEPDVTQSKDGNGGIIRDHD
jgi:hypothetical protein